MKGLISRYSLLSPNLLLLLRCFPGGSKLKIKVHSLLIEEKGVLGIVGELEAMKIH